MNKAENVEMFVNTQQCDLQTVECVADINSLVQIFVGFEDETNLAKTLHSIGGSDPFSSSAFMPVAELKNIIQIDTFPDSEFPSSSSIGKQIDRAREMEKNAYSIGNVQLLHFMGQYDMIVPRRNKQHCIAQMCLNDLHTQCELLLQTSRKRQYIEHVLACSFSSKQKKEEVVEKQEMNDIVDLLEELHQNVEKYPGAAKHFQSAHALDAFTDSIFQQSQDLTKRVGKAMDKELFTAFLMPFFEKCFQKYHTAK